MKKNYFSLSFFLILLSSTSIWAQLAPQQIAPLYEHLHAINKEWAKQPDLDRQLLAQPVAFELDEQRIQLHLLLVEKTLRKRKTSDLSPSQVQNRLANLDNLSTYWQRNLFPKNTGHPNRQPYFIDNFGTACAVGHLVQTSGHEDFAAKISLENNFAYIDEMTDEGLPLWATDNGFSSDELAWIQPTYGDRYCTEPAPITGVVSPGFKVLKYIPEMNLTIAGGSFVINNGTDIIFNIAGLDGENWSALGTQNAIDGTVYAVEYFQNKLYIAGDFVVNAGTGKNIAYWSGSSWVGVQTGTMAGTIKTLKSFDCKLYAGGDFALVNQSPMPYIAAWDGTNWSQTPSNCQNAAPTSAIQVNGTVNVLETYKDQLLVGGTFDEVTNNAPVKAIGVWDSGWQFPVLTNGDITVVNDLETLNGAYGTYDDYLFIAADSLSAYAFGNWYYPEDTIPDLSQYSYHTPNLPFTTYTLMPKVGQVHLLNSPIGYIKNTKTLFYAAGNSVFDLFDYHALPRDAHNAGPSLKFDGPVTAISSSRDYLDFYNFIYAGDFTTILDSYSPTDSRCISDLHVNIGPITNFRPGLNLPIELTNFTAQQVNKRQVAIDWTTLSEINSSHIEIERKTENQADFRFVGKVTAAGESIDPIKYSYLDNIAALGASTVYYRLKLVDIDGNYAYSEIRVVKLGSRKSQLSLSPNPASESVYIQMELKVDGPIKISLYNLHGQQIRAVEQEGIAGNFLTEQLDVNDLKAGIYFIEVNTGTGKEVEKLVIGR